MAQPVLIAGHAYLFGTTLEFATASPAYDLRFVQTDGSRSVYIGTGGAWLGPYTAAEVGLGNVDNTTAIQNPESATNSYTRVKTRTNLSVISKTTAVTIGAGAANDTYLHAIHIVGTLTGTCVITGFLDSDNVAQSITIPVATTARTIEFKGAINAAGPLTFTCSNAADDNLVVVEWSAV